MKGVENHEIACKKNPNNWRVCFECIHIKKQKVSIYEDTYIGEVETVVELLYCSKIDSFLYPPSVERKGNAFELGDDLNEPMRKECEHLKHFG